MIKIICNDFSGLDSELFAFFKVESILAENVKSMIFKYSEVMSVSDKIKDKMLEGVKY